MFLVRLLILSLGVMFTTTLTMANTSTDLEEPVIIPNEYVVKLRNPARSLKPMDLSKKMGVHFDERLTSDSEFVLVKETKGRSIGDVLSRLQKSSLVEYVEPNVIYRTNTEVNDSLADELWGLSNIGQPDSKGQDGLRGIDVNAAKAWNVTRGSDEIIVAVIDSGVDYTHPDLVNNMWINEAEKNGQPGVDDDQNGFVDDIYGYDFGDNDGDPMDQNGHGTHCAGTIGAEGGNSKGVVGVNWNVKIMALKFLGKSGGGSLANAVKAIDYATQMGAHLTSNSWGCSKRKECFSQALKESIQRAAQKGVLFVAAAGNDGQNNDTGYNYPSNYEVDNILAVAAIDNRGNRASFSNYGRKLVDIAAPGVNILSTVPGGKYKSYSGTSMATPHVAGVAALVLSQDPTLTALELKSRLMETSLPMFNLKYTTLSGGMVDAYAAVINHQSVVNDGDPEMWNKKPYKYETSHSYKDNTILEHRITIPGAQKISLHFKKFETEFGYDELELLNVNEEVEATISGELGKVYSPVVYGDTVILRFTSDANVNDYGFAIDHIAYQ